MDNFKLTKEEEIFAAKIDDYFRFTEQKNIGKSSAFLDERQQEICKFTARRYSNVDFCFAGGYDGAQRKVLRVLADYETKDDVAAPITAVTFTFRPQDSLTHRDFLGSLMALKIKREYVGDILVAEGRAVVFLIDRMVDLVMTEIHKIGRVGVKSSLGYDDLSCFAQKFSDISGTVSSMRLDCVLSMVMNVSRENANRIIASGAVAVNYIPSEDRDLTIDQGDIISIRGFGKIKVDRIGLKTKKNRIHLECRKFM